MNDALLNIGVGLAFLAVACLVFAWIVALCDDKGWAWALPLIGGLIAAAWFIGDALR